MTTQSLESRLSHVKAQINKTTLAHGRTENSVHLLAVSKTQNADTLRDAYTSGQRAFGENYLQEARQKQEALKDLSDIEWHFIGPIQSNKTREISEHFDWVHSVDRLKIARRLSEQRPDSLPPLNVCLQVNIDDEESKSGVSLQMLPDLVMAVKDLPRLQLRGLMAIPAAREQYDAQLASFNQLAQAKADYPFMDTLSMGMSADMSAAIAAGSTIVRVGTAIFGERQG